MAAIQQAKQLLQLYAAPAVKFAEGLTASLLQQLFAGWQLPAATV